MKKTKKLSLIAAAALGGVASIAVVACTPTDGEDEHVHEYSWTITQAPTSDAGGKATGECKADGTTLELDLPKLGDTEFWTVSEVSPTHTEAGYTSYANATYKIEYKVDGAAALGHSWGSWTVKAGSAPDAGKGGIAVRLCTASDGGTEEVALKNLADASWTEQSADYVAPTKDAAGKIVYKNTTLNFTYEITLNKLTDKSFWTVDEDESYDATHAGTGLTVYKNAAFALTVNDTIPALGHTWGEWSIDPQHIPTTEAPGVAIRTCTADDGGTETTELPKLEVGDFWSCKHVAADYNTYGHDLWTAKNGTVSLKNKTDGEDKWLTPYDSKSYVAFDSKISENSGGFYIYKWTSPNANITLDENAYASGEGKAAPFNGVNKVTMLDGETGKVEYAVGNTKYIGYVDMSKTNEVYDNSYIVLSKNAGVFNEFYVFIPTSDGTWNNVPTTIGSCWAEQGGAFAITVTADSKTTNIFIYKDKVYFGVAFKSGSASGASAIAADACADADYVYVADKSGNRITAFAKGADGTLKETDGNEGTYNGTIAIDGYPEPINSTATLDGIGGITVTTDGVTQKGRYVVKPEDGVEFGIYLGETGDDNVFVPDKSYYEITGFTDQGEFIGNMPMVNITLHDAEGPAAGPKVNHVNKNIPVDFMDGGTHDGFIGIYTDAAYKNKVTGKYTPTEAAELYVRWSDKYIVYFDEGSETGVKVYYAAGMNISEVLPQYKHDFANRRKFLGWSTVKGDKSKIVDPDGALGDGDAEGKFYVIWEDFADYVGDFEGRYSNGAIATSAKIELKIDLDGNIEGKIYEGSGSSTVKYNIDGKVVGYDKQTGVVTWQAKNTSDTYTMLFYTDDEGARVLAIAANSNYAIAADDASLEQYYFVLAEGKTVANNFLFDFYNGVHNQYNNKNTIITSFDDDSMAIVYANKLYGNISATDHLGNDVTVESLRSKDGHRTIIITDAQGAQIVAFGTTAEKFGASKDADGNDDVLKALDGWQGKYTCNDDGDYDGVELVLDGMGNVSWQGSEYAMYTATGTAGQFDVYERTRKRAVAPSSGGSGSVGDDDWYEEGDSGWGDDDDNNTVTYVYSYSNKVYYAMTLNGDAFTASFDKPMITVNFAIGTAYTDVGTNDTAQDSYNKNIPTKLVKPSPSSTHMFAGWYTDADCTQAIELVDGKYIPKTNIDLYSKWVEKSAVNVYYVVDGGQPVWNHEVSVSDTDIIDLSDSTNPGYVMVGVYTDAACTQEFTETQTDHDINVYIKWRVKQEYENSYMTATFTSWGIVYNVANNFTMSIQNSGKQTIVLNDIDASDIVCLPLSGFTTTTNLNDVANYRKYDIGLEFDKNTNIITFNLTCTTGKPSDGNQTTTNTVFYGIFDPDTKIILTFYAKDSLSVDDGFGLFVPTDYTIGGINSVTTWGGKTTKQLIYDYTDADGVTHTIYVRQAKGDIEQLVLTDCTLKDEAGNVISAIAAGSLKSYIEIYDNKHPEADPIKFIYKDNNYITPGPERGTYTCIEKADLYLDGSDKVTWGTKSGTYEAIAGESNKFRLKISSDSTVSGYLTERYIVTLSGSTYTVVEDKVTITFVSEHGAAPTPVTVWRGVSYTLPTEKPTATGYKFSYWYTTDESTGVTSFTPNDDNNIVTAKWAPQVTVTYHYNDGGEHSDVADEETIYSGETIKSLNSVDFKYGDKVFKGWFTKDGSTTGDWGDEFKTGATISADTDVYAKWVDPSVLMGTYKVVKLVWGGLTDYDSAEVVINGLGAVTKGAASSNKDHYITTSYTFTEPDSDGIMQVKNGSNIYFAYYDALTGAFAFNSSKGSTDLGSSPYVVIKVDSENVSVTQGTMAYNSDRYTRVFSVIVGTETKYIFIYEGKLYYDVTVEAKDKDGKSTTDLSAAMQADGEIHVTLPDNTIVNLIGTGSAAEVYDNTRGTYTLQGGTDTVELSGYGKIKIGDKSYDLTKVGDDDSTTYDVNTGTEYLQYTFNFAAKTYTVNKPMVTITYVTAYGGLSDEQKTVSVNKNISYALPSLSDDTYIFLGWFYDEEYTQTVTLASGGKFNPVETDTLYAKWALPHVLRGTWKGGNVDPNETGIVQNNTTSVSTSLVVDELGKTTGWKVAEVVFDSDSTNTFDLKSSATEKRQGSCDLDAGLMFIDFASGKTQPYHDIDLFVKVVDGVAMKGTKTIAWDSACSKLIEITMTDETKRYALIYNGVIYGLETVSDFDTWYSNYNTISTFTVTKGSTTWTFNKEGSNFVLETA